MREEATILRAFFIFFLLWDEDSPYNAAALPHVVEHQRDVAARRGRPGLRRKKKYRGVMTDGASPLLPAPPADTLFSLPRLSSPLPLFPPVLLTDSCVSKGDTSDTLPAVRPPKNAAERLSSASLQTL